MKDWASSGKLFSNIQTESLKAVFQILGIYNTFAQILTCQVPSKTSWTWIPTEKKDVLRYFALYYFVIIPWTPVH